MKIHLDPLPVFAEEAQGYNELEGEWNGELCRVRGVVGLCGLVVGLFAPFRVPGSLCFLSGSLPPSLPLSVSLCLCATCEEED